MMEITKQRRCVKNCGALKHFAKAFTEAVKGNFQI